MVDLRHKLLAADKKTTLMDSNTSAFILCSFITWYLYIVHKILCLSVLSNCDLRPFFVFVFYKVNKLFISCNLYTILYTSQCINKKNPFILIFVKIANYGKDVESIYFNKLIKITVNSFSRGTLIIAKTPQTTFIHCN